MPCTPNTPATDPALEIQRLAANLAALDNSLSILAYRVTGMTATVDGLACRFDALEAKAPEAAQDKAEPIIEFRDGKLRTAGHLTASELYPASGDAITEENIIGNRVRFDTANGIGWAEYRPSGVTFTFEPAPPPSPDELAAATAKLQAYLQRQAADMRRLASLAQSAAGMADALAALTSTDTVTSLRWVGPEEERRRDDREDLHPFTAYLDDRVFAGDQASEWQRTGELARTLCATLTDRIFRPLAEHYDGYDAPLSAIAPIARAAIYPEGEE